MIIEDIRNFPKQFEYEPEIVNSEKLNEFEAAVIGGMGGSGLVAGVLRALKINLDVAAHHEYGLPAFLDRDKSKRLFIAISYSGNTEETVDFFNEAYASKLNLAAIATGGKLIELAVEKGVPYIQLPQTGIQPRMALGYIVRAVLKLLGEDELFNEVGKLSSSLKDLEKDGEKLADNLFNKTPVIYSSRRNQTIAYNWKIKFNETGKIPAYYNTFPELNHNEMTGFDVTEKTQSLSSNTHFVILEDDEDDKRIAKRMKILEKLYADRGLGVTAIDITGKSRGEKIFNAVTLVDWAAYFLANKYGVEPEDVPMVEEFKKLL